MRHTQMMIIGSGPAGCTAAIYASRAGLTTTVMEGMQPGGQLTITTQIDNYPGFSEGVDANELMDSMRAQAERFGAQMLASMVTGVNLGERPFRVWTDGKRNGQPTHWSSPPVQVPNTWDCPTSRDTWEWA